jgi:hypothetical protein
MNGFEMYFEISCAINDETDLFGNGITFHLTSNGIGLLNFKLNFEKALFHYFNIQLAW